MTATKERTLAIIKPGAFKSRHTGAIISDIQARGFQIVEMRLVKFTEDQAKALYQEHAGRPFFDGLIDHATMAPSVVLVLEGTMAKPNVIKDWRDAIGPTDPSLGTAPHHLRAKYGFGMPSNALHGSDSPEAFAREYGVAFNWGAAQALAAVRALAKTLESTPPDALAGQLIQEAKESSSVGAPAPGSSDTAGG